MLVDRYIYYVVVAFHKLMIRFCDTLLNMKIIKISFSSVSTGKSN